ncbi:hypothetical protein LZ32DRAFT_189331 [Colletotrichum eremochloae]|nr:hypothetical protein LZ32DRAFT_189331 [Colletotrichum eremochloae]
MAAGFRPLTRLHRRRGQPLVPAGTLSVPACLSPSFPHDPVCSRPILTESRLVRGSHAEPTGGISVRYLPSRMYLLWALALRATNVVRC